MNLISSNETDFVPDLTKEIWVTGTAGKIRLLHYNSEGAAQIRESDSIILIEHIYKHWTKVRN